MHLAFHAFHVSENSAMSGDVITTIATADDRRPKAKRTLFQYAGPDVDGSGVGIKLAWIGV